MRFALGSTRSWDADSTTVSATTADRSQMKLTSGSTGIYGYGSNKGSTMATKADRATLIQTISPSFSSAGRSVKVMRGHRSRYA